MIWPSFALKGCLWRIGRVARREEPDGLQH
jgi:hypothetical protein